MHWKELRREPKPKGWLVWWGGVIKEEKNRTHVESVMPDFRDGGNMNNSELLTSALHRQPYATEKVGVNPVPVSANVFGSIKLRNETRHLDGGGSVGGSGVLRQPFFSWLGHDKDFGRNRYDRVHHKKKNKN